MMEPELPKGQRMTHPPRFEAGFHDPEPCGEIISVEITLDDGGPRVRVLSGKGVAIRVGGHDRALRVDLQHSARPAADSRPRDGPGKRVVTFMLTDVEGSSRLWEAHPERMARAILLHDAILRNAIRAHHGLELTDHGEGDSFCAVFELATQAVAAACQIQRRLRRQAWPGGVRIRVRIALNTGEAGGDDYRGRTINRCARVREHASGGQVLMTTATAELVWDSLPAGARLVPLGQRALRDVARPEQVFSLALSMLARRRLAARRARIQAAFRRPRA